MKTDYIRNIQTFALHVEVNVKIFSWHLKNVNLTQMNIALSPTTKLNQFLM